MAENNLMIYACSGASDLGEVSDRTARKLRDSGFGKMSCLAALGAGEAGYIDTAKAGKVLIIDGCQVACGRKIAEKAGVKAVVHTLTDMGYVKGKTPPDAKVIAEIADILMHAEKPVEKGNETAGSCGCGK